MSALHFDIYFDKDSRFVWIPEFDKIKNRRYFAWLWFYGSLEMERNQ